jgi:uncharacterized repeat protein (TIGR03803 family)
MKSLRIGQASLSLLVLCVAAAIAAPAQNVKTLQTLSSSDLPDGNLVQGIDGNLYGTNYFAGQNGYGDIFKITPDGVLTTIYTFTGQDGRYPTGLVLETDGNLYGTTRGGGAPQASCPQPDTGCGTVYRITPAGEHKTLHSFNGVDGINPVGALTVGPDGSTLYGTTYGSFESSNVSYGTIFKITGNGIFTLLHTFSGNDGNPIGPLVVGANGNLYGTTEDAGIFELTPDGTYTPIPLDIPVGVLTGALVQAANGDFYGTAQGGGFYSGIDCPEGCGAVFVFNPGTHVAQTLYEFTGGTSGGRPVVGVVLGADGNFYGATEGMGSDTSTPNADATLFKVTPEGVQTNLHGFFHDVGDSFPWGPGVTLMQATNGTFYGTTADYGPNHPPTVFSLSAKLGPFVSAVPSYRGIGARVLLLGQDFTGATSVTFNGVPATFTVNSDTEIVTIVPTGATKGFIVVTTPSGTVSTKVFFTVG